MMVPDEIQWPDGFGIEDLVSHGSTGLVVLDSSSNTVIKKPLDPEFAPYIDIERQIYERIKLRGCHRGILSFHGVVEDGIRLEYAAEFDLKSFTNIEKKLAPRYHSGFEPSLPALLRKIVFSGLLSAPRPLGHWSQTMLLELLG